MRLIVRAGALALALSLSLSLQCAAAEASFAFPASGTLDPATLQRSMQDLARRVLTVRDESALTLDDQFRAQLVAQQYPAALATLEQLRKEADTASAPPIRAVNVQYAILARAKVLEAQGSSFNEAFTTAFHEAMLALDDRVSALVIRAFDLNLFPAGISLHLPVEESLREALERRKGRDTITLPDALALIHTYQVATAYRIFTPLVPALIAEDDARRYIVERDVAVKTPDGATICALIMRPRQVTPLPALLEFTIYADPTLLQTEARRSASNGYAGVQGLTRGKGCSPDQPVPYEHDGDDADALINWISRQPWSDSRVGMFGGSYNGFTQWAAAKHKPEALKALMPQAPVGPGIDVPMEGNIFWNFVYPWPFYTLDNKGLDPATYADRGRWLRLDREYYRSGRSYHELDQIDGTSNPTFARWVSHPGYDGYWQAMIPQQEEFSHLDIPILTTAGYFLGGPGAAVHYLSQHYRYNPRAEHYLLIGPYDHAQAQRGTIDALGAHTPDILGYARDPVALIDIEELRYQWFDYVFKHAPKPALLQNKINYQVMGANSWKHAASLAAMSDGRRRLYFGAAHAGGVYALAVRPEKHSGALLTVDFADRTDLDRDAPGGNILDTAIDTHNGLQFVSEPFDSEFELSGLFSGRLDFIANWRDFDFNIQLYELTRDGHYFQLPPYWARASGVADESRRQLLTPGKVQHLVFASRRLVSRRFAAGSQLVMVLSVLKEPGREINYGSGKIVSEESMADAREPLSIRWLSSSFVDIPIGR